MYWPLGAPQVFAAPAKRDTLDHYKEDDGQNHVSTTDNETALLGLCVSRNGYLFATISATTLYIWQTSPVILLTTVLRSKSSLESYGSNAAVLLRPDATIAAVQTSLGYLVTYQVQVDPKTRVYQQIRTDEKAKRMSIAGRLPMHTGQLGQREVHIRFRMVIKIDAGIGKSLAIDDELVVATKKPAAVQCIRWTQDESKSQTSTELLSRVPWMTKSNVTDMVYNRQMNLFVWITSNGHAYAVQKQSETGPKMEGHGKLFKGFPLHAPRTRNDEACRAAINARFSLLAVGCSDGQILVYTARDYSGSLPLSHKCMPPVSFETSGRLTCLIYSPDGYCLFAGYERGWTMWSVFGKIGGSSFSADIDMCKENDEVWLTGCHDASWIDGGTRIMFTSGYDDSIMVLNVAKSAMTGCFVPSNASRMLHHTSSEIMIYRGHDASNITALASDITMWTHVQMPLEFLANQSPIRSAVISSDGRYIAIAGRRGIAHYSIQSGRWKTFDDPHVENSFTVRGGMFWYQHILVTAVETEGHDELRLYSREMPLNDSNIVFVEPLPAPVVTITPSGDDSLLVYTYENNLYHYVIDTVHDTLRLVQFGAIGLHGIVRAPARVRAVTWYIPEHQLLDGDPAQDVMQASVIFLVDAKLVLLQPLKDDRGDVRYDMKIIANNVEWFSFTRDQVSPRQTLKLSHSPADFEDGSDNGATAPAIGLVDSLWYFDGQCMQCWPDVQEILRNPAGDAPKEIPLPTSIPVDFYPTSVALNKSLVIGLESDLVQRRDTPFALYTVATRTQLFLPPILRQYLATSDATSALSLCHHYQKLSYFSHALEVLLHTVLDDEVDAEPKDDQRLLPTILSFLASFPDYLDILVQCTRKTEVRSWKTLFATLPPPRQLFQESLRRGQLKTAGGYLLVLHTLEEDDSSSVEAIDLLQRAKHAQEWDLCKEIARFLVALDPTGDMLREAMEKLDMTPSLRQSSNGTSSSDLTQLKIPRSRNHTLTQENSSVGNGSSSMASSPGNSSDSHSNYEGARDYFTRPPSSSHVM